VALSRQQAVGAASSTEPPNVVFFLFDKCRTDAIGAYGASGVHTPNLDWLSSTGFRFSNCYTPQPLCTPARASILTGLYPHAHGLRKNVYQAPVWDGNPASYQELIPSPFFDTRFHLWENFPLYLHSAGYETAHIGKWHLGVVNPGFFDTWNSFNSQLQHWVGKPHESRYRPDVHTEQAVEFIHRSSKRPFFLYLSFYPPHERSDPPREFLGQYRGEDREHLAYYASVSNLDWNVGRVLDVLRSEGVIDNTLIITATDHGRTWKERPGTQEGMHISYEDSSHIPLIIRFPGLFSGGKTWESGVSLVDIMPTILDVCGVSPYSFGKAELSGNTPEACGRSLADMVRSGRDEWDRPIVIQSMSQTAYHNYYFEERGVRYGRWKLILRRFDAVRALRDDELYDLQTDPSETRNVIADRPDTVHELGRRLEEWASRSGDAVGLELARRAQATTKGG